MKGECLCGEVAFTIDGELPNFYQCHCSLCRKATGAAANAAPLCRVNSSSGCRGRGVSVLISVKVATEVIFARHAAARYPTNCAVATGCGCQQGY